MNSRKLIALFLVFALTGSALAAQQERLYGQDGELEAEGVVGVQQHSVFVEIVVEQEKEEEQIHKFAAVVGLIKKCVQERNVFDNAVLWFNDQFLFGDKRNDTERNVTEAGLGYQPNDSTVNISTGDGFIGTSWEGTPRWGGCYTPDGFAHAIGADDPFGTFNARAGPVDENASAEDVLGGSDNIDAVKELIELDHDCSGCIFEYHSSFFVVDPNGHEWIVDKYVYPLSVMGNLFESGAGADCGDDESDETWSGQNTPFSASDPRGNQHHADTCKDPNNADDDDRENHCYNNTSTKDRCDGSGSDGSSAQLVEPLFSTHLQVNPQDPGLGFADKARFQYNETDPTTAAEQGERQGALYPMPGDETRLDCEAAENDWRCAIEYNFLIAVDFAAFDGSGISTGQGDPAVTQRGENEVSGCAVDHGEGGADNDTAYWQGNSHPHNPEDNNRTLNHCHSAVNLDIFFYDNAPVFTIENQYWKDSTGEPVSWGPECNQKDPAYTADDGQQASAISERTPLVCDADSDQGEFHVHDDEGSQIISDDR